MKILIEAGKISSFFFKSFSSFFLYRFTWLANRISSWRRWLLIAFLIGGQAVAFPSTIMRFSFDDV